MQCNISNGNPKQCLKIILFLTQNVVIKHSGPMVIPVKWVSLKSYPIRLSLSLSIICSPKFSDKTSGPMIIPVKWVNLILSDQIITTAYHLFTKWCAPRSSMYMVMRESGAAAAAASGCPSFSHSTVGVGKPSAQICISTGDPYAKRKRFCKECLVCGQ